MLVALLISLLMQPVQAESPEILPGTGRLVLEGPLDEFMVAGIDRFALNAIAAARKDRETNWPVDFTSLETFNKTVALARGIQTADRCR
ncbi:MAG: hypothetical protein R3C11_14825 [Planctomycetaceae bacterium]